MSESEYLDEVLSIFSCVFHGARIESVMVEDSTIHKCIVFIHLGEEYKVHFPPHLMVMPSQLEEVDCSCFAASLLRVAVTKVANWY